MQLPPHCTTKIPNYKCVQYQVHLFWLKSPEAQLGEILQTIVIAIALPNGPKYLKCKCGTEDTKSPVCYIPEPNTIMDALETKVTTIYFKLTLPGTRISMVVKWKYPPVGPKPLSVSCICSEQCISPNQQALRRSWRKPLKKVCCCTDCVVPKQVMLHYIYPNKMNL